MIKNILIIEDNVIDISYLTNSLEKDYSLKISKSGSEGIEIAKKSNIDLILLDIGLPGIDGYEVCELLKKNPRTSSIPIIFLTSRQREIDENKAFLVGGEDFIHKPFDEIILKSRIKNILSSKDRAYLLEMKLKERESEVLELEEKLLTVLGTATGYNSYQAKQHVKRVSLLSYLIAKEYGFNNKELYLIYRTTVIHDLGKIGLPNKILKKRDLTEEEESLYRKHSEIGGRILKNCDSLLLKTAKIIIEQHHERWDGSGYPLGLKGEEINIHARIVAVADTFDVLCDLHKYSVKKAKSFILENREILFDPKVVDAFEKYFSILEKKKGHVYELLGVKNNEQ